MSARQVYQLILCCDGCGAELAKVDSATEARAIGYTEGWRYPRRLLTNGKSGVRTDDVCPACLPGWTPRQEFR